MKIKSLITILIFNYNANAQDIIFINGFEIERIYLNDTGITWAGEYSAGNSIDCISSTIPAPQDCNTGRDFTNNNDSDGHGGFNFTKLDSAGSPLVDQSVDYATTPWACVKDNVTGLIWEVKTLISGIHNINNTYRWGGKTAIGISHPNAQGTYFNDWDTLVDGSNTEILCGFNNWRVPRVLELSSIANKGSSAPSIDIDYFPNTVSLPFWSSSPLASIGGTNAWVVLFGSGSVNNNINRSLIKNVRLVCSGQ